MLNCPLGAAILKIIRYVLFLGKSTVYLCYVCCVYAIVQVGSGYVGYSCCRFRVVYQAYCCCYGLCLLLLQQATVIVGYACQCCSRLLLQQTMPATALVGYCCSRLCLLLLQQAIVVVGYACYCCIRLLLANFTFLYAFSSVNKNRDPTHTQCMHRQFN